MTEEEWLISSDPARMLRAIDHQLLTDHGPINYRPSDRKLRLFVHALMWAEGVGPTNENKPSDPLAWLNTFFSSSFVVEEPPSNAANLLRDIIGNPWRPLDLTIKCDACGGCGEEGPLGLTNYWRCCYKCGYPEQRYGTGKMRAPWLTTEVLSLAEAAYENRLGGKCEKCDYGKPGEYTPDDGWGISEKCKTCKGTGYIEGGLLDPARLAVLSDALEEADCPIPSGRTISQVIEDQSHAVMGGCCDRFANQMACSCLSDAEPDGLLSHLRSPGPHVKGCYVLDLILNKE